MGEPRKIYCAGEWKSTSGVMEVTNPYNGETIAAVFRAGAADVERATAAAVAAFREMKRIPAWRREEILLSVAAGLKENSDLAAMTMCLESGKPIKHSRVETDRAINVFKLAAEECKRIVGEFIPMDVIPGAEGRYGIYRRYPLGPICGISPFNFPLNLVSHKLAPALATGNSIVLKPASSTPLSSLFLAELFDKAGLPKGALSVLPCSAAIAEKMVGDSRFKMLTFTGSPVVGWALRAKAGSKRVTLELGGNAGAIVHKDADVRHAARRCAAGAFVFSGQVCIHLQRILVHRDIFDEFAAEFLKLACSLKLGDPADESTDIGPMIEEKEATRAREWLDEAVAGGAKVLCGGGVDGSMFHPTVITNVMPEMKVCRLEVFAPIVTLTPYDDIDAAIREVDDSDFGLQAGLFTYDMRVIEKAAAEIEVGGLMINEVPTYRIDQMPYGGVKLSGAGREGVRYAIEEMTEQKLILYSGM